MTFLLDFNHIHFLPKGFLSSEKLKLKPSDEVPNLNEPVGWLTLFMVSIDVLRIGVFFSGIIDSVPGNLKVLSGFEMMF